METMVVSVPFQFAEFPNPIPNPNPIIGIWRIEIRRIEKTPSSLYQTVFNLNDTCCTCSCASVWTVDEY